MDTSESAPLLPTSGQSPRSNANESYLSSAKRSVNLLQRYRQRHPMSGAGSDGIESVLCELEQDEARSFRLFMISLVIFAAHLLSGALLLTYMEGWSFSNSIYFCVVTTTTVGYGDITPQHIVSRIYVIFYVIGSIALFSAILSYLIGLLIDQQEEVLLAAIVGEEQNLENESLELSDEDTDQSITAKIMRATTSLDLGDYFGLAFSALWFVGVLIAGVVIFMMFENLSLINALYTTIISASTVGFGDFKPTNNLSKGLICVWLLFSTTCVVKVVAAFTDASVKAKQRAVTRRLLTAQMDLKSLRAMDRDGNKSVDKVEFVTELLVRSGKVERSDVDLLLMRFEQLDKTKSGEVTLEEVMASGAFNTE